MKRLLVVCLLVLVFSIVVSGSEPFALADRVGESGERSFFMFSTSAGNYIVRHDGMGEFSAPNGRRRVFNLRFAGRGRIERIYFLEHEKDLFICYEVSDITFVARMEQTKRKLRWRRELSLTGVPEIDGDVVILESIRIRKGDGTVVTEDQQN